MSQAVALWFLLVLLISTCNATVKPQHHVHVEESSACKDCTICQYPDCINNQLPPPPPPLLPPPLPPYQGNCQPPPAAPGDCCPQNMGPPPPAAPADCCGPQNLGPPPPPPVYIMEPSAASEPPLMKSHTFLLSCFVASLTILIITFVFKAG